MVWKINEELDNALKETAYDSRNKGLLRYWGGNSRILKELIRATREARVPEAYVVPVAIYLADRKFNGSSRIGHVWGENVADMYDKLINKPSNIRKIFKETMRDTTVLSYMEAVSAIDAVKKTQTER